MSVDVYLANSHRWLREKLVEHAVLDGSVARIVESRRAADLLIYLEPPWPDPEAPDRFRTFRPRDLLRTFVFSQKDDPVPWAPGVYASVPTSHADSSCFAGGFYVAHHHHGADGIAGDLEAARELEPSALWGFMGTLSNHPVRRRLRDVRDLDGFVLDTQHFSDVVRWGWQSSHRVEGREAFSTYASMLGRSSFVLCPRGYGSSTIRLFEALQVGRCPVVISDDWLPPPFVDWSSCSITVPEARILELPKILRERESEAASLGRQARTVWECFFSPQNRLRTLVDACLTLDVTTSQRLSLLASGPLQPISRRGYRAARRGMRIIK